MKKYVLTIIIAVVVLLLPASLFAQNTRKIAFSLDIVPLVRANLLEADTAGAGGALNSEFFIGKNYSLGIRIEGLTVPNAEKSFLGVDGHIRYYFKDADISGFFLDMGVGWGFKFINNDELEMSGLTYSLKAGYKHLIVKNLFVEPAFSYTLAKPTAGYGPGGFDLGFSVGYAF